MKDKLKETDKSRIKRAHQRADYDRDAVNAILDATPMCHVAYLIDGAPHITPTFHWREGNHIYWHGSSASRFLKRAANTQVSLCVSCLDGLVLARSAFHHSVNYRSVILYGEATPVKNVEEKEERLRYFLEGLCPGRWDTLRPITQKELTATSVLGMPIDEGAAKVRTGQPVDDEEDYALSIWAGVLPLERVIGEPVSDPRNLPGVEVPAHVRNYREAVGEED
ncbi:MAG: pyridoxamine 5'-phosphate oxidase family protein [Hyphomicrobiales bacterium]|nr:pyridoxamine 5'-phosphate oxidase family protein [Hyphomicrobiales bacterium]